VVMRAAVVAAVPAMCARAPSRPGSGGEPQDFGRSGTPARSAFESSGRAADDAGSATHAVKRHRAAMERPEDSGDSVETTHAQSEPLESGGSQSMQSQSAADDGGAAAGGVAAGHASQAESAHSPKPSLKVKVARSETSSGDLESLLHLRCCVTGEQFTLKEERQPVEMPCCGATVSVAAVKQVRSQLQALLVLPHLQALLRCHTLRGGDPHVAVVLHLHAEHTSPGSPLCVSADVATSPLQAV
jgi:hypothetical protein